jgi:hypothetical protein
VQYVNVIQHTVMWRHVVQLCCPAVQFETNPSLVPSLPSVHDRSRPFTDILSVPYNETDTNLYSLYVCLARCCRHVCTTGHTGLGVRQFPQSCSMSQHPPHYWLSNWCSMVKYPNKQHVMSAFYITWLNCHRYIDWVFGQRGDFVCRNCFVLLLASSAAAWCQNRDTILLSNVNSGVHWLLASLAGDYRCNCS